MKMWIFFGAGLLIVNRVGKEKYSRKKKSQLESHNIFFILTVAKCGVSDDDARWPLRGKKFTHLYDTVFGSWRDDVIVVWAPRDV